jgi:ribonuclease HII
MLNISLHLNGEREAMLKAYLSNDRVEAGCDEAGRGCLAGPVTAAAVILPSRFSNPLLNDSKKLNVKQRDHLRGIIETQALAWQVAFITPLEIDDINILNASFLAMHKAIQKLSLKPDFLLIDGNRFKPFPTIDHACIIKGDGKYMSIAAASILAKTHRDAYMKKLSLKYSKYGWEQNKGYPTKAHRNAIIEHGPSIHHRQSFRLYPGWEQGALF